MSKNKMSWAIKSVAKVSRALVSLDSRENLRKASEAAATLFYNLKLRNDTLAAYRNSFDRDPAKVIPTVNALADTVCVFHVRDEEDVAVDFAIGSRKFMMIGDSFFDDDDEDMHVSDLPRFLVNAASLECTPANLDVAVVLLETLLSGSTSGAPLKRLRGDEP